MLLVYLSLVYYFFNSFAVKLSGNTSSKKLYTAYVFFDVPRINSNSSSANSDITWRHTPQGGQ